MTYFLKKKKWMAWVVLLTFLFTSFMPSNILAGNSVAEAAISGSDTVAVGETITLTSDKGDANVKNHSWEVTGSGNVNITNNGRTANITGSSEGAVTVTHYYQRYGWHSEIYQLTVTAASDSTRTVYVYVKVEGDTSGLVLNEHGWYTIGTIQVPASELPDAKKIYREDYLPAGSYEYGENYLTSVATEEKLKAINRYSNNTAITTNMLYDGTTSWSDGELRGLNISDGATDYDESGWCWHLDGRIYIQYKYVVNHYLLDVNGKNQTLYQQEMVRYNEDDKGNVITAEKKNIVGYDYAPSMSTDSLTLNGSPNEVLNLYYMPSTQTYTVNYLEKGTNIELNAPGEFTGKFGDEITSSSKVISIGGYRYDSVDKDTLKLGAVNDANVINIYYTKRTDLSYTVNYYKDSVDDSTVAGTGNFLGSKTVNNVVFDTQVRLESGTGEGQLDWKKPSTGYQSGVQQGTVPYTVIDSVNNVINVVYAKKNNLSYTVNYYKDSVDDSTVAGTGNFLGSKTVNNVVFNTQVRLESGTGEGQLDWKKPSTGYQSGVQQGTVPYTVIDSVNNVINVVYAKKNNLSYTVNYYKDSVDDSTVAGTGNFLGSKTVNNVVFDTQVRLESGTGEGQLDWKKPSTGYQSGVQQGTVPYTVIDSVNNVINVVYAKKNNLSYTVNYLEKDTNKVLSSQKVVNGKTFEEEVTESAIEIEGYDQVAPTSKIIEIAAENNVINFYYTARTDISYTVEYRLRDENGRKLADDRVVDGQTFGSKITESAIPIEGYTALAPTEQGITLNVADNKIVFLYDVADGTGYKVNYYYQDRTGAYNWSGDRVGTTKTGAYVSLTDDDKKSTTPGMYVYNGNVKTIVNDQSVQTVENATVAADGKTVLNAFFDQRFKVIFKSYNGDILTAQTVKETGYVYGLDSQLLFPLFDDSIESD